MRPGAGAKANGAEGFIGNEYYVDWQGQRLIYVTIQFFALKMRELFEDSETEFGADEHGELLVHESFFSPLDDEKKKKEVKEEGGVRPQKDWRDCWYERYGYE